MSAVAENAPVNGDAKQSTEQGLRRYVRPIDVSRHTGLGKTTVMEAIWSGELQAYRRGRAWLIPVEAVDRWIRGDDAANIA